MYLYRYFQFFVFLVLMSPALCRSRGTDCKSIPMRRSDHNNCSMYFECIIDGVKVKKECPIGKYFNETLQLCELTHTGCMQHRYITPAGFAATTEAAPPECNHLMEMIDLWPYFGIVSLDCKNWLRCASAGPVVNGCPKGMKLGPKNLCKFPPNVHCVEGSEFKYIHPIFDDGKPGLTTERGKSKRRGMHSRGRKRAEKKGKRYGRTRPTPHTEERIPSVTPRVLRVPTQIVTRRKHH